MVMMNVSADEPCKVCGEGNWCSYDEESGVSVCRRGDGRPPTKKDASGVDIWIVRHHNSLEKVDCNEFIIDNATLSQEHHDDLIKRGFNDDEIKHLQYRSVISKDVVERIKSDYPSCKYITETGKFTQPKGMVIPLRNKDGEVIEFKVRLNAPGKGSKYKFWGKKSEIFVHYPIGWSSQSVIRITEGEIKADYATLKNSIYTVGISGVSNLESIKTVISECDPEVIHIAFDMDWKTNANVRRALVNTIKYLQSVIKDSNYKLSEIKLEDWDSDCKGIDDALLNNIDIQFGDIEEASKDYSNIVEAIKEFVWVNEEKRFVNKIDFSYKLDKEQFNDKFSSIFDGDDAASIQINRGEIFFDKMRYVPAREQDFYSESKRILNTWIKPKVVAEEGDISIFTDHMEYLFPDKYERDLCISFLATIIQEPDHKMRFCMVLRSDFEGNGKSLIFTLFMKNLIGHTNFLQVSGDDFDTEYTERFYNNQLIAVEEVEYGSKRGSSNKLKRIISENTATCREIFGASKDITNYTNIVMLSNEEIPVFIKPNDRRYMILDTNASPKHISYYRNIEKWCESKKNINALYYFLINWEFPEAFDPFGRSPLTNSKKKVINDNRPVLELELEELIESKAFPFDRDIVSPSDIMGSVRSMRIGNGQTSFKHLSKLLENLGCVKIERRISVGNQKIRPIIIRNHDKYINATDAEIAEIVTSTEVSYDPL